MLCRLTRRFGGGSGLKRLLSPSCGTNRYHTPLGSSSILSTRGRHANPFHAMARNMSMEPHHRVHSVAFKNNADAFSIVKRDGTLKFAPQVSFKVGLLCEARSLFCTYFSTDWVGTAEFLKGAKHAIMTVVHSLHTNAPLSLETYELSHMIGGGLLEDMSEMMSEYQSLEEEEQQLIKDKDTKLVETIMLNEGEAVIYNIQLAAVSEASGTALYVKVDVGMTLRHIHRIVKKGQVDADGEKFDLQRAFVGTFEGCVKRFGQLHSNVEYKLVELSEIMLPSLPQLYDEEPKPDEEIEDI